MKQFRKERQETRQQMRSCIQIYRSTEGCSSRSLQWRGKRVLVER